MDIVIIAALGIVILLAMVLIVIMISRGRSGDTSEGIKAFLLAEFSDFQRNINQEMHNTRESVQKRLEAATGSVQDVRKEISTNAVDTVKQLKDVGGTVEKLIAQQKKAEELGQSLKDLLQAPKLRGSYGEAVLEEMLDRVLPRGVWERQYRIDGNEMVDCIVRFKDVVVPIDAKFPRDDYVRYIEAEDQGEKADHWKSFEKAVKIQVNDISDKYVKPERGTSEFALMFIPSEAIYYETIAEKNHIGEPCELFEYAQTRHVIPVSPNTLYPFLQVVILGIRNIEIINSAKELQKSLSELERSFGLFYKKYEDIGKNLDKASKAHQVGDGHIQRYKRRLEGALKLEGLESTQEIMSLPSNKGDAEEMKPE